MLLTCLGALSFEMYLIHVNPIIWNTYTDKFKFLAPVNLIILFFRVLGISVAMYIVYTAIDVVRSLVLNTALFFTYKKALFY